MQPRLTRSSSDKMLAGVCGGLGDYFNVDPVIVRLIFVLVTLTSGIGLPVYIVLWLVMPKSDPTASANANHWLQQNVRDFSEEATRLGQQIGQEAARIGQQFGQEAREVLVAQRQQASQQRSGKPGVVDQPPPPSAYRFDPFTGQPIRPDTASTGETVNLGPLPPEIQAQYIQPVDPAQPPYTAPPRRSRNWSTLGMILIGIGGLILLEQIGINMSLVFPILLIVAGIILLRRRR